MPKNEGIECTVNECKHHSNEGEYCSLNRIKVVKHGGIDNSIEHTDCSTFEPKK